MVVEVEISSEFGRNLPLIPLFATLVAHLCGLFSKLSISIVIFFREYKKGEKWTWENEELQMKL